jgi:hypothetical protein
VTPAVFSGVQDHFEIAREEVFGPVACVLRFEEEEVGGGSGSGSRVLAVYALVLFSKSNL